jgi:ABC-type glycerol-3-phosphate transport system substrate-binding protein
MKPHSRSRARVVAVALATAIALGVTACSAGGGTTGPKTSPNIGQSAEAFLKKAGKATGTSSISVLAQASPQANAIQKISDQFTQLTGITVNWTVLDEQSQDNKAAVALGSGDGGYDVIQTAANLVPTYATRGWIESIDALAAKKDLQVPGWSEDAFGQGLNGLLSYKGHLYAAPMFIGTQVYYYRTDLFKAAGITKTPTTYKELVADAKKVDSDQVAGIALRSAPDISQLLFDWSAWLYAYGGSYYKTYDNGSYSGSALDSKAAVDALSDYADLLQHDAPSGATNWSVSDVTRAFASGQVAIIQEGAVFGGTFNNPSTSQVAGKVGTFTLPSGPAGSFVPYNSHGWAVAKNSKATDAAWLFTQWATLAQTLTTATQDAKVAFSTPPLASVYTSKAYQKQYGFDDYVSTVTKTLKIADNGGVSPLKGDPNYQPSDPSWSTVGQQIAQELSKAVTGQESPEAAIRNAAGFLK